jgi:hypothetical protein
MQEQPYDYDKLTQATTQLKQVYTEGSLLTFVVIFSWRNFISHQYSCLALFVPQVEREIEGKEWTTRMVTELAKTLMDLKETLFGTQNKAAEIEIGSALHKHVVSSVQNAEVRSHSNS